MKRRHFLKALPLTTFLAGCMGESTPENSTVQPAQNRSPTRMDKGTPTAQEPSSVSILLRSSYRYSVSDDDIGVKSPEYDQFAFITSPVTEADPSPSAFRLILGNEQFSPATSMPGFMANTPGIEAVYTEDSKNGSLAFDIPTTETEHAVLLYDDTRYPLTEDARNRLATAPQFSLESVSVPETVAPDEYIELSITVKNDGDGAGTYLAGFRTGGLPKTIDVPVEPGETGTGSATYEAYADSGSMYFDFDYPGGNREYDVTIQSEGTTEQS